MKTVRSLMIVLSSVIALAVSGSSVSAAPVQTQATPVVAQDWMAIADQAAAESATAMPFVESDGGGAIPVWWIAPVAYYAGKKFGWQDSRTTYWTSRVLARKNPDGGYGLGYAWDWRGDGTTNPANTSYTITTAGHVGRTLIAAYDDGGFFANEIRQAATSLLNTSTTAGGKCVSYSNSTHDRNKPCVFNVTAHGAWFLWSAAKRGLYPAGRQAEMDTKWRTWRDYTWTHFRDDLEGYAGAPGWAYEQGQNVLQDPWHHAATVWPLYEMDPVTGLKGLNGHYANYGSTNGANADLVVYDCARITPALLADVRRRATEAYTTQRDRLTKRSRWALMAMHVHYACYSSDGPHALGNFDGDPKADLATWRPNGTWWVKKSGGGTVDGAQWGQAGDIPRVDDLDADGKDDYAVFRPSSATWWIQHADGTQRTNVAWGKRDDVPLVGDVDGDGKGDLVTWRPKDALWSVQYSGGGTLSVKHGAIGDLPLLGDIDGDHKDDLILRRPSTGKFHVRFADGTTIVHGWGGKANDVPLIGDVDGDDKDDYVVWAPGGAFWVSYAAGGSLNNFAWGQAGDVPLLGDVNGDGKEDLVVFRPSNATWHVAYTGGGSLVDVAWGAANDVPA